MEQGIASQQSYQFPVLFEPELIKEILEKGSYHTLKEGDVILKPGQTIKMIPVIIRGIVKVSRSDENGNEIFLYYVHPGESCAMSLQCCMQQMPSEIKAVAETETEIFAVPVIYMDPWLVQFRTWRIFVMMTYHNRFNELLGTIDQIAFQHLDIRLINYLKERRITTGSALVNLSHDQIANDLASSRVVISRLLKKLEDDGKLLLFRNQIKLLNDL